MGYLEVNNLITSDKSAYKNQHNTQTALHRVVDDWLYNISDGNFNRCMFFWHNKVLWHYKLCHTS